MNARKRHTILSVVGIVLAIVMIVVGSVMIIFSINRHEAVVTGNQDDYLLNSVRFLNRSFAIQMDTYRTELDYLIDQVDVQQLGGFANHSVLHELLYRLRKNPVAEDPYIHGILVIRDGQAILSTTGSMAYRLSAHHDSQRITSVMDTEGNFYLALPCVRSNVTLLALVDMQNYFSILQQSLPVATDRLYILSGEDERFLYYEDGEVMSVPTKDLPADHPDYPVMEAMLLGDRENRTITTTIECTTPDGVPYDARLAVLPKGDQNITPLTFGMSIDFTAITSPIYSSTRLLVFYVTMLMLGATIMSTVAVFIATRYRHRREEVEDLKEKNAEMAQLTERTLSLYHHQRLETLGTLTSSIAHEFGNLLTPIMGYSIMTLEALPPEHEDLADNLREIYEASRNAKTVISRLNDLSRKNTGASYAYLSPDALVRKALSVAKPSMPDNVEVKLILQAHESLLHGNETQLSQMLLNLLLNAFHAMQDTGGVLSITTRQEGRLLRIRVSDTGVGIAPENLPKIFDPFFTTREAGKGTGLGLSVAQQVVKEHGGDISVASEPGKGTVFHILFPIAEPPEEEE